VEFGVEYKIQDIIKVYVMWLDQFVLEKLVTLIYAICQQFGKIVFSMSGVMGVALDHITLSTIRSTLSLPLNKKQTVFRPE
jgi:hypothetical protein